MKYIKPLLLTLFLAFAQQTWACSCMNPPEVKEALENSAGVFTGTVLSIENNIDTVQWGDTVVYHPTTLTVTIQLETDYKNGGEKTSRIIKVKTKRSSAACGYPFQVGSKYIVYAYQNKEDGMFWANICSRTKPYDTEEVARLDALVKK